MAPALGLQVRSMVLSAGLAASPVGGGGAGGGGAGEEGVGVPPRVRGRWGGGVGEGAEAAGDGEALGGRDARAVARASHLPVVDAGEGAALEGVPPLDRVQAAGRRDDV